MLLVRDGKGQKDRMAPLTVEVASSLNEIIKGKGPDETVIGLGGPHITMRIKHFARRAGLPEDFHAHSLRHKYCTDLLEAGANIKAVQMLMGHQNLNTTEVYLSVTDEGLRQAVNKLEGGKPEADTGRCEASFSIEVRPAVYDPLKSSAEPAPTGVFFEVEIPSASILVEGIQLRTTDPGLPFKLMVFENDPAGTNQDPEREDVIRMEPVSQRVFNYSPSAPVKYINQAGGNKLFGAVVVYQRPLPVAILSEPTRAALLDHLGQSARFSFTVQYCNS